MSPHQPLHRVVHRASNQDLMARFYESCIGLQVLTPPTEGDGQTLLGKSQEALCLELPLGWERIELRCAISMMRLTDPAKGGRCAHRSRCNFDMLRSHAARSKVCPIVGCDAPLARTHEVQRDDALHDALSAVPAAVDVVWLRGTEVRQYSVSAVATWCWVKN